MTVVPVATLALTRADPEPIVGLADSLQPGELVGDPRGEEVGVEGSVGVYVAMLPVTGGDADPATLGETLADPVDDALVPVDDTDGVRVDASLPLPVTLGEGLADPSPDPVTVWDDVRVPIDAVETPDAVDWRLAETLAVVVLEELTHVLPDREELGLPDQVRTLPVLEGDGDPLTVRQVPVTVSVRD